ncbi:MAG: hypothetical protein RR454_02135, partial [Clostridia bacterium]
MGKKFKSVSLNATIITILFVLVFLGTIFVNTSNGGKDLSAVALTGDTGNITANWGTPTDQGTKYWKGNSSFTFNNMPSTDDKMSFTLTTIDDYNRAFSSRSYAGKYGDTAIQTDIRVQNTDYFLIQSAKCSDVVACLDFNINPTLLAEIKAHPDNYTLTITTDVSGVVYSGDADGWQGPTVDYFVTNSQQPISNDWDAAVALQASAHTKTTQDYSKVGDKGTPFGTPNQTITVAGANLGEHNAFYIKMNENNKSGIDVSHKNVKLSLQRHGKVAPTINNLKFTPADLTS